MQVAFPSECDRSATFCTLHLFSEIGGCTVASKIRDLKDLALNFVPLPSHNLHYMDYMASWLLFSVCCHIINVTKFWQL